MAIKRLLSLRLTSHEDCPDQRRDRNTEATEGRRSHLAILCLAKSNDFPTV
jgi:hypothetical protein